MKTMTPKERKATFKFYAVQDVPYVGGYKVGTFNNGEPQIMFAMDFHTWIVSQDPKEEQVETFKEGILQTLTHEFCHAMQEFLDKEYDELEVEKILGAYKPTWNVFEAEGEDYEPTFKISEMLEYLDNIEYSTGDDLKRKLKELFASHKLWLDAQQSVKTEIEKI